MNLFFDIGGTNMRLAVSKGIGFGRVKTVPTPEKFEVAMKLFGQVAKDLVGNSGIGVCVGGCAGPMNKQKTKLLNPPNLKSWHNRPLAESIKKVTGARKIILENDAALAGLGEAVYGAGLGHQIIAYLTISTGVGGARIVNKKIDTNALGFEPGAQIIALPELSTFNKNFNSKGSLGSFVSGRAIEGRFNIPAKEIRDKKIWHELSMYLAYGLNNAIVFWSPDVIVLGGSIITKDDDGFVTQTQKHLKNIFKAFTRIPKVKKSQLGDLAGIYGAMALLKKTP